jgi:uncharacterized protein YecE (DUF72 family)
MTHRRMTGAVAPRPPEIARRASSPTGEQPVHIGCSGWNYRAWRGDLYPVGAPARVWLELYAQRFDTVEVNATFYRLMSRAAVAHWVAQTPTGFVFAVKASRYLTHVKRLANMREGVSRFYERIEPLIDAGRLGPVLWQLPETFARDDDRLSRALEALPAGRHAFEFRHPSWFTPDVYALLRARDAALVAADHPARPSAVDEATASWRYVRFHFGARGRRGNYSATELDAWAARLRAWRAGSEVFAYFNNDWESFAPHNALDLRRRLERAASG